MIFDNVEYNIDPLISKFSIRKANSSNVDFYGYRQETETLFVQFHSGATYTYLKVPHGLFEDINQTENITQFINHKLKNKFTTQKIPKKLVNSFLD